MSNQLYVPKILQFINSPARNTWLYYKKQDMAIYVRKEKHHLHQDLPVMCCFDIASVEIHDEAKRSKGVFSALLTELETYLQANLKFKAIYIESIMNERLPAFLEKRGYKPTQYSELVVNYYLLLNKKDQDT